MRRYSSAYSKHLISSMFSDKSLIVYRDLTENLPVERLIEKSSHGINGNSEGNYTRTP